MNNFRIGENITLKKESDDEPSTFDQKWRIGIIATTGLYLLYQLSKSE